MPKRLSAFTLIELLVIVAIVGILTSVATIQYSSSRSNSRDTRRKQDALGIKDAMEAYRLKNGSYFVTLPKSGVSDTSTCIGKQASPNPTYPSTNPLVPNLPYVAPAQATFTGTDRCVGLMGNSSGDINTKGGYYKSKSISDALMAGGYLSKRPDPMGYSIGGGDYSLIRCSASGSVTYRSEDAYFTVAVRLERELSEIEVENFRYYCGVQPKASSSEPNPLPPIKHCRKVGEPALNKPYSDGSVSSIKNCQDGQVSFISGNSPVPQ